MLTGVDSPLRPGELIAQKYRLERQLGRGASGPVFLATHQGIGRKVAIKFLDLGGAEDEEARERFEREGHAAASLGHHTGVVDVLDVGTSDAGLPYLVMEYLEGQTLERFIQTQGPVDPSVAAAVLAPILSALQTAHSAGIVHRDLKPANVMLTTSPARAVKLLDFGVSKVSKKARLTGAGVAIGTPNYMAPEQALDAQKATPSSDLYSVGVLLFELLSGRLPFSAPALTALMVKVVSEPAPPLATVVAGVDPKVAALVDGLLAKEPASRPADASHVRTALLDAVAPDEKALWTLVAESRSGERRALSPSRELPLLPQPSPARPPSAAPTVPVKPVAPSAEVLGAAAAQRPIGPTLLAGVLGLGCVLLGLLAWDQHGELARMRSELDTYRAAATAPRALPAEAAMPAAAPVAPSTATPPPPLKQAESRARTAERAHKPELGTPGARPSAAAALGDGTGPPEPLSATAASHRVEVATQLARQGKYDLARQQLDDCRAMQTFDPCLTLLHLCCKTMADHACAEEAAAALARLQKGGRAR